MSCKKWSLIPNQVTYTHMDTINGITHIAMEDQPVQPHHHHFPYTYILNKSQSFNPSWFISKPG